LNKLEIILIGFIILFPIIDLINEKYKSNKKTIEYLKISFFLWLPTFLLLYLYSNNLVSVIAPNIVVEFNWQNILLLSLLVVASVYLVFLIKTICSNEKLRAEVASQFESFKELMPETRNQMLVFTLVLSISAGICEELIFRAYLYTLIKTQFGLAIGIILSSLMFGLWHVYLGWKEVLKTAFMGAILCGIYLLSGNIILPILIHAFIDIYSALISYFAMRKSI